MFMVPAKMKILKNRTAYFFSIGPILILVLGASIQKQKNIPEMVKVDGGSFTMGCTDEQFNCGGDEKPTHQVKVAPFFMGKYEVTVNQWKEYIQATGMEMPQHEPEWGWDAGDGNFPMVHVSWLDVVGYCNWLSREEGLKEVYSFTGITHNHIKADPTANGYRMPTESEWEYAARGGAKNNGRQFSGSDTLENVAWYKENASSPSVVGKKQPNELGLFDMSGNVDEWCQDVYSDYYYEDKPLKDPTGPERGTHRVIRGGNYEQIKDHHRVSIRDYDNPRYAFDILGFRVARKANK